MAGRFIRPGSFNRCWVGWRVDIFYAEVFGGGATASIAGAISADRSSGNGAASS